MATSGDNPSGRPPGPPGQPAPGARAPQPGPGLPRVTAPPGIAPATPRVTSTQTAPMPIPALPTVTTPIATPRLPVVTPSGPSVKAVAPTRIAPPVVAPPGAPAAGPRPPAAVPPASGGPPRAAAPLAGGPPRVQAPPGAPASAPPSGPPRVQAPPGVRAAAPPSGPPRVQPPPAVLAAPPRAAPFAPPRVQAPPSVPLFSPTPVPVLAPARPPPVLQNPPPAAARPSSSPSIPLFASSPTPVPAAARPSIPLFASSPTPAPVASPRAAPGVVLGAPGAVQLKSSPLAPSGSIEGLSGEQTDQLARMAFALEFEDYFQMLQVPQTATGPEIKRAFYRESRIYHPDRFYHLADGAAKAQINTIYKRVTEAYYVLRDDARRKKYLADISGPDRVAKLRFSEASETEQKAEAKKATEEEFAANPRARQFFKSALADLASNNLPSAERNLKMGLTYDPSNQKFKDRLVEVQKKLDDLRRSTGDTFKIK